MFEFVSRICDSIEIEFHHFLIICFKCAVFATVTLALHSKWTSAVLPTFHHVNRNEHTFKLLTIIIVPVLL